MGEARAIPSRPPIALARAGGHAWAPWLRWLLAIASALGALALARAWSPSIQVDPRLGFLSGFTAVALSAVLTAAACPQIQPRALIGVAIPAVALLTPDPNGASDSRRCS